MDSEIRRQEKVVKRGIDDHTNLLKQIRDNTIAMGENPAALEAMAKQIHELNKKLPKAKGAEKERIRTLATNIETVLKYNNKSENLRAYMAKEGGFKNAFRIAKLGISQAMLNKLATYNINDPQKFEEQNMPFIERFNDKMDELITVLTDSGNKTKKMTEIMEKTSQEDRKRTAIQYVETIRNRAQQLRSKVPLKGSGDGSGKGLIGGLAAGTIAMVAKTFGGLATMIMAPIKKISTILLAPIAAIKGLSGAVGGAFTGALSKVGGGMSMLAGGLRGFASAGSGVAVFGGLLLAIGGATWLFGSGVEKVGNGLSGIADSLKKFNEIDIDPNKMKGAADGMGTILTGLSGWDNLGGAIVSLFVSPNGINGLVDNINKINTLNIDATKVKTATDSISAVLTSLSGSAGIVGALTSNLVDTNNISRLVNTLNHFNNVNVDREKVMLAASSIGSVLQEMGTWRSFWGSITSNFIDNDNLQRLAVSLKTFGDMSIDRANVDNATYAISNIGAGLQQFPTRALAGIVQYLTGTNPFIAVASGIKAFSEIPDITPEKSNNMKMAMISIGKGIETISLYDMAKANITSGVMRETATILQNFQQLDAQKIIMAGDGMISLSRGMREFSAASLTASGRSLQESILGWFSGSGGSAQRNVEMAKSITVLSQAATGLNTMVDAASKYDMIDRMTDSLTRLAGAMRGMGTFSGPIAPRMGELTASTIATARARESFDAQKQAMTQAGFMASVTNATSSTTVNNTSLVVMQEGAFRNTSLVDTVGGRGGYR